MRTGRLGRWRISFGASRVSSAWVRARPSRRPHSPPSRRSGYWGSDRSPGIWLGAGAGIRSAGRLLGNPPEVGEQGPHAVARPARWHVGVSAFLFIEKRSRRDVEVGPRPPIDKLPHEDCPFLSSPKPGSRVAEISDGAAHVVQKFFVQRQFPQTLASLLRCGQETLDQGWVVAHNRGGEVAKGHECRAGERGEINDLIGALL